MAVKKEGRRFGLAALAALIALGTFVAATQAAAPNTLSGAGCVADAGAGLIACSEHQGLAGVEGVAVSPDGESVYAVSAVDRAVVHFSRAADGSLTAESCIDDPPQLSGCDAAQEGLNVALELAVSPDGRSVYATGFGDNAVVSFDRAADGTLTPLGCIDDAGGSNPCDDGDAGNGVEETEGLAGPVGIAISPDGDSVYTASRVDNAIVQFDRAADGTLTPVGCISDLDDAETCATEAQGLRGATGVAISPDGASVYVGSGEGPGPDHAVVRFDRAGDGGLTPAGCISDDGDPGGCGVTQEGLGKARFLVVSPDGSSVHVAGSDDSAVATLDRASNGALSPAGCISDLDSAETCGGIDGGDNEAPGLSGARGIAISPDGESVVVTGGDDNAVANLSRGPAGTLTAAGCVSDLGSGGCDEVQEGLAGVESVTLSPDGGAVYAGGTGDNAVVHLNREVPPTCFGAAARTDPGSAVPIEMSCVDPNGDPLTYRIRSGPSDGSLSGLDQNTGVVTYTPDPDFEGADFFSFDVVADGKPSNLAPAFLVVGAKGPKLLLLMADDKLKGKSGSKMKVRYATSAGERLVATLKPRGKRTKQKLKKAKLVQAIKKSRNLNEATVAKLRMLLKAKRKNGNGKRPVPAGTYKLILRLHGTDGQKATDTAKVRVKR